MSPRAQARSQTRRATVDEVSLDLLSPKVREAIQNTKIEDIPAVKSLTVADLGPENKSWNRTQISNNKLMVDIRIYHQLKLSKKRVATATSTAAALLLWGSSHFLPPSLWPFVQGFFLRLSSGQ